MADLPPNVEAVLAAVELIPPGEVVSYGDLAELVGTSPRRVGAIMARYGGSVTWWRVTNSTGRLPEQLLDRARQEWHAEGIGLGANGSRCLIEQHRTDLGALANRWEQR